MRDRYAADNTSLRARGEPYEWQSPQDRSLLTAGVDLRFPPVNVTTHRGLILHLQSIAGNDYEPQVLDYLRGRGWAVVDIKTATHVSTPVPPGDLPRIEAAVARVVETDRRITARNQALRAQGKKAPSASKDPLARDRTKLSIELARLRAGSYQVDPVGDLEPVACRIAADIDQTLAGNAYAVEAVLDYITKQRQDLLGGPIIVMGFSAGALATPTVVARIREHVDAVVMVGGGADLFMLAQRSEFTDGGVIVRHGDKPVPSSTIAELDRLYLKHSRLDPYHTAESLRGLPVLQVDATLDTWVPTPGNDLLYKRLGNPDRLRAHLAGHMMLFYFLPSQSERIADWLEQNTQPSSRQP